MGIDWKDPVAVFGVLILVYLLVKNGTQTASVISALAGGLSKVTNALQGQQVSTN